jgi:hypothetical protein
VWDPGVWISQVQGPNALRILEASVDGAYPEPFRYFDAARVTIAGQPVVITRTGFTKDSSSNPTDARPGARRYRAIFISDLHLGSPGCKAECLHDFLRHVDSDDLYLVGDVVDCWRFSKRWFWPERHEQILRGLLARARRGTAVVYLPAHHDEALRKLIGRTLGGVRFFRTWSTGPPTGGACW